MSIYKSYCAKCKKEKIVNPYQDETEFNRAYGIETKVELPVFIARKSGSHKQVKPTLEAHIKVKR